MHQTIYVDIDEEITSIIERLRKVRSNEAVIVVPKRALLIQSIVNLRILKKEAENLDLAIMIVTQDKLGKLLIEKAGILVQPKLEDIEEEMETPAGHEKKIIIRDETYPEKEIGYEDDDRDRLKNLGSENYFDEKTAGNRNAARNLHLKKNLSASRSEEEKITNKELVVGAGKDIKKRRVANLDSSLPPENYRSLGDRGKKTLSSKEALKSSRARRINKNRAEDNIIEEETSQDEKIESFFYQNNLSGRRESAERDEYEILNKPSQKWKIITAAGLILAAAGLAGAFYMFIPKATVAITAKIKTKSVEAEIKGDVNYSAIDYNKAVIPAKLVSAEEEISRSFNVSGSKSASSQKARGTLTIYNEFSSSSQPLVATTRFLSAEGKLFRLIKGVVVPGTVKDGDRIKPGQLDAEAVADQAGEEYNIGPSNFTVPGFKDSGSEKYAKIYAKSSGSMTGGKSDVSSGKVKVLAEGDISSAKSRISLELADIIKNKIKDTAGDGMVVLSEAVFLEEAAYKLSNSAGEVIDKFTLSSRVKGSAVVFREADLKDVVNRMMAKLGNEGAKTNLDSSSVTLDYGKSNLDFKLGTIMIKVHGVNKASSEIDAESLKKEILGKNNSDLENILGGYPDIEKAEVTYWPPFISSRIPKSASKVNIVLDNGN